MFWCLKCNTEMLPDKNSVGLLFGNGGHVYPSDRFKCPSCNHLILKTNATASFDPELSFQDEYVGANEAAIEKLKNLEVVSETP